VTASRIQGGFAQFQGRTGTGASIDFINDQLKRFGVTFEDLQRIAKENGIQLLDKKGNIVASAFGQSGQGDGHHD